MLKFEVDDARVVALPISGQISDLIVCDARNEIDRCLNLKISV
jgi:hypothetical protein